MCAWLRMTTDSSGRRAPHPPRAATLMRQARARPSACLSLAFHRPPDFRTGTRSCRTPARRCQLPLASRLFQLAGGGEARAFLADERAHSRCRGCAVGLDQHGKACPWMPLEIQMLGAVDDVVITVAARHRAHRLQIGAAIGLGQCQPAAQFASGKSGENAGAAPRCRCAARKLP